MDKATDTTKEWFESLIEEEIKGVEYHTQALLLATLDYMILQKERLNCASIELDGLLWSAKKW